MSSSSSSPPLLSSSICSPQLPILLAFSNIYHLITLHTLHHIHLQKLGTLPRLLFAFDMSWVCQICQALLPHLYCYVIVF